ncbi:MAG TPA: ABC transporter substrate-binding protein [Thermodesulfobacteriota bacterium]
MARPLILALGVVALLAVGLAPVPASAQSTIRIGEINSYSGIPAFTLPYRNGAQLAVEEVNAAGGVLGRKLEVLFRDDAGKPGDAVTAANNLVAREGVALLAGTFYSHVGLAVSDFANQRKVLFVAAEPLTDALIWEKGNRYTFRLRPGTYMQAAMLVEEAAKLPAKRWATVAPNYEYGQAAVAAFRKLLSEKRPDVEWVAEQWPALGKIDAGATIQALARAKPEAIFNVTFGGDLARLVREGQTVGFFKGKSVVSLLSGEPEYLDPLGAEAPEGWIVTGYPWYAIDTPEHRRFVTAYRERFDDTPRLGSLVGYNTFLAIAAALRKAGSTDTDALVAAMKGLTFQSPIGPITFRPSDHQSTMGAFVGRLAVRDGKGVMVDWRYADGARYLPDERAAAAMRPAE